MLDISQFPHIATLDSIETNFKVYAGPGAGKTTWLAKHLERVLRKSNRLGITSKIACITYTNVAAEEIRNNIDCDKNRFDISTIHSFLYRNIVKPFSYLIANKDDLGILFNIIKMDGHEEHIVQREYLRIWINEIGKRNGKDYKLYNSPDKKADIIAELSSIDYIFNGTEVELTIRNNRGARLPRKNGELWVYKEGYWRDGIMHHEDVLYFSYLILSKSKRALEFIRSKYPYIYIDEFQDTTELQTWIIEKICEAKTIVGVVGDIAQSIYKFAGAKRNDFVNFHKGNIAEYKIDHNRRSTKSIVKFLNMLRTDICQLYEEKVREGAPVNVLIGSINSAKHWVEINVPNEDLYILTRKNNSVSEINNELGAPKEDILKSMYARDSNYQRAKFIHSILMGHNYYKKGELKSALKELVLRLKNESKGKIPSLSIRKIAIEILSLLNRQENRDKALYEYYVELKKNIQQKYGFSIGADLRKGDAREFYESHTVQEMLPYIKVDTKHDDLVRTIHSAKGATYDNVLIHVDSLGDFRKYILNCMANINSDEDDTRVYYVGCSRARSRLFINVPNITEEDKQRIVDMNVICTEL